MTPKDKKVLWDSGFVQAEPSQAQQECAECKRKISGGKVWWLSADGSPWCGPCARFFVELSRK